MNLKKVRSIPMGYFDAFIAFGICQVNKQYSYKHNFIYYTGMRFDDWLDKNMIELVETEKDQRAFI